MSDDEVFVFIVCDLITLIGWGIWYYRLLVANRLTGNVTNRLVLACIPVFCLGGLFLILKTLASFDVRDSFLYLLFYMVMGAAWLVLGRSFFTLLDIRWRDDALERGNMASVVFISFALLGLTACFAGSNVGDGPGWWCVAFSGSIATVIWFLLWLGVEKVAKIAETITVDRDVTTAFRCGAYLLASGMFCGRGAAGDWVSWTTTVIEFQVIWPVLVLTACAALLEKWLASRPEGLSTSVTNAFSVFLGFVYLIVALEFISSLPPLSQNPIFNQ